MPRRVLSYGFLALTAVAATTGFVAHRILDRPGESAFALVPANALGVASLDLVPAPDQVLAFKHIDETIAAANGGKTDTSSLLEGMVSDPILKPMVDQIDRSVALAYLPDPSTAKAENGDVVAFIALKDPTAFEQALRAKGKPEAVAGEKAYWIEGKGLSKMLVMVHDAYAIASDKTWPLAAVEAVVKGAPAITSVPAFATARESALPSSNLLVLVNPDAFKDSGYKTHEWLVSSMAIREKGMEFAVSAQTDDPHAAGSASIKPLGATFLDAMPRGAYGFWAVAQPGSIAALAGKDLDEPAKDLKKETDLDLKADVLPALGGNMAIGFYPSLGVDAGIDLLVSVDDTNGADPATLARKLEGILTKEIEKDKSIKGPWKVPVPAEGAEEYRLADHETNEMQKGARDAEKSFFRPFTLAKGKTVAWATVGNNVLLATSQDLLNKAVFARRNPSAAVGISGDTAFGENRKAAADGQFSLAISMSRLAEGMRNTIDPSHMSPEQATYYRKTLSLFDATTEPLAMRSAIAPGGHYTGYTSIPLDWSKLPAFFAK